MRSCWVLVGTLLILAAHTAAAASLDLIEEVSFEIPFLSGSIEQVDFEDITGDGYPEALAATDSTVVLYSISGDSVVASMPLDSVYRNSNDKVNFRILLADVNHDGGAEVLIVYEVVPMFSGPVVRCWAQLYSEAGSWTLDTTIDFPAPQAVDYIGRNWGVTMARMVDVDRDGTKELMVAYQQTRNYYWEHQVTEGRTICYESFPDSIAWSKDRLMSHLFWGSDYDGRITLMVNRNYETFYHLTGVGDHIETSVRVARLGDSGSISTTLELDNPMECWGDWYQVQTVSAELLACGDIYGPENVGDVLVLATRYNECVDFGGGRSLNDSTALELYQLAEDGTTPLWTAPVDRDACYFFASDQAGSFFKAFDGVLTLYDGTTAEETLSNTSLPEGDYAWTRPYDDDRERLVVTAENRVSIFRIDVATAVNDVDPTATVPQAFRLAAAYPNPFNAELSVKVEVDRPGPMRVELFNLLGRRVALLHDGPTAVGDLDLTWHANGQASGVYLLRVASDDETATAKVVLMK